MGTHARISLVAVLAAVIVSVSASAVQAAGFGIEKFVAANCKVRTCGEGAEEPSLAETEKQGYVTAGGHPPFGVTDFVLNTVEVGGAKVPVESVKNLRTDVAAGDVTNPQAVTKCSLKDFESTLVDKEHGFYLESHCPQSSIIARNIVLTAVPIGGGKFADVPLEGLVYNLEQPYGLASDFGVALNVEALAKAPVFAHTYIEGGVEWLSDYHDYYLIKNVTPGLIRSRLIFKGEEVRINGKGEEEGTGVLTGFLRNPTKCTAPGPETTTSISMESYGGAPAKRSYATLVGTQECLAEPFKPAFEVTPATSAPDAADGITAEAAMPHPEGGAETDSSDLLNATFTLPPGMTINPSAGAGLEGCTPEQIGLEPVSPAVTCPAGSRIGTVNLEVPTLPRESLSGPIFLGKPAGKQIEGPPYTIYFDAESARYGVKVRLKGTVTPNLATGQLTTTFANNPQAPFNNAILHFKTGGYAPVANPLECGAYKTETEFTPFSGGPAAFPVSALSIVGCASSPPAFAPTSSLAAEPAQGGANSTVGLNLERPEGQQYISSIRVVMPPGVVGQIPAAAQCGEPQAALGTCPAASQIGTVAVASGSGEPYTFHGKVYLTGPFEGGPFGLSIVVPPSAGPFTLPNVVARARIEVNPYTGQVIATDAKVPTIAGGIPIRMRALSISINRQGFERNPTFCGPLTTETTLTGFTPGGATATKTLLTPFQAEGCGGLAFSPSFSAASNAKTSRANGASLETTINQAAGQANIKSVLVQLPLQLPSRQSTFSKACLPAVFAANPFNCGPAIGGARANTPVLPGKLSGPAYFVARGGAQFPDLDLVMEANGVRVILVGTTKITKGITTTDFAAPPDVPVSSITVNLPTGPLSALAANGNLCTSPLIMPTTIEGQNGKVVKQNTTIKVNGCGVQVVGKKVIGNIAYLTIKTFAPGRISGSGTNVATVARNLANAENAASLKVPLSPHGRSQRRPLKVQIRVGFLPKKSSLPTSTAYTNVTFG